PADEVPACGPSLDYLLDVFPLTDVLSIVLSGDGSCAEIVWSLFGVSIPGWTLLAFAGLLAVGAWQILRPQT
ncbi:MAG: disulfide bond formation protein B, partial [SAR86 cluster bacterium]|nr:disulfide bond formation protein B [SAR86 cluster bacterium]